jgi:hypothetical protein
MEKMENMCNALVGNIKENRPLKRLRCQNYTELGLAAIE